ncbi:DUF3108 domain-containing protein [Lutibacter sp.]|uniref:DUF3108 domain-containing protein n=1 Tax=Lutibacter sp. TaxID=1925666 RepID=UPI0027365515|nr:DUF3108 domain-containing protein [Lutibacter sp.]MDP3314370.1 DUF3108 domain-containing protein [Lutibacter sp.]
MKKYFVILFTLLLSLGLFAQPSKGMKTITNHAFKHGEWLKFRMSYSNFLNAGYSTIQVSELKTNGRDAFHIAGIGKSTGLVSLFFTVKNDYQTYMYKETLQPYKFIRKINEGGYTKDLEILFDYETKQATVKDFKHNKIDRYPIGTNIQDMMSALYFLRNQDMSSLKVNDQIDLKMFIDDEVVSFKLHFLGKEVIRTKFGKIRALKFRPLVQTGRVFKEQESLTIWVSDDDNKIPLQIKASLAVGSLRADLDEFKGLAHPFNIIF